MRRKIFIPVFLNLFFLSLFVPSFPAQAQIQRDPAKMRAKLLELSQRPPLQSLRLVGVAPTEAHRRLTKFYAAKVFPRAQGWARMTTRFFALRTLLQTESYSDERERERWTKEQKELIAQRQKEGDQLLPVLREFARLAEGLQGELPDRARTMYSEEQVRTPNDQVVEGMVWDIIQTEQKIAQSDPHMPIGEIGFRLVSTKGDEFNRLAIAYSELAKEKGYPTRAAESLSRQGYSEGFQSPAEQRQFLENIRQAIAPAYNQLLAKLKTLNVPRDQYFGLGAALLAGSDRRRVGRYLPPHHIVDIWTRFMGDAGFDNQDLAQVYLFERSRTSPSLGGILDQGFGEEILNQETLNFEKGGVSRPGMMVLTLKGQDGIEGLAALAHEGGHAIDRLAVATRPTNPGTVEVPSTVFEHLSRDREFLANNVFTGDLGQPSSAEIETWLKTYNYLDIKDTMQFARSSLFELELWDYDYSLPGAKTFLERADDLTQSLEIDKDRASLYSWFHRRLGEGQLITDTIRAPGYSYAQVASQMIVEHISKRLKEVSGRSSWANQPEFAKIYRDEVVKELGKLPFPQNIEAITGQKFDAQVYVDKLVQRAALEPCEELLVK